MTDSTPAPSPLILHIWPPHEAALSIEPESVASLLYLQLCIPGRYSIKYCNNPDLSPSGQLPYLTHGLRNVAGFESIVKYVDHLDGARYLDDALGPVEKAQMTARVAHVVSELGDLVAHVHYALSSNWVGRTRPTLANMLPVPQRYFVPRRLRDSFKIRLEAVDLWDADGVANEEEEERQHWSLRGGKIRKSKKVHSDKKKHHLFARDRVLAKARAFFDIYARLLGGDAFIYGGNDPTVLDIILAAHVHLLHQPMPDTLIKDLLTETYPGLVAHSKSICQVAFPDPLSFPAAAPHTTGFSFASIIPIPHFPKAAPTVATKATKPEVAEAMRRFKYFRWGFFAVVAVTMGLYLRIGNFQQQIAMTVQSDENFKQALLEAQRHRLEAQATRKQATEAGEEGESAEEDAVDESDEDE